MIKAEKKHQARAIELICSAFSQDPLLSTYTNNKHSRMQLIARLAFETSLANNAIFMTDDLNAVAMCKHSKSKVFNLNILWITFLFPFVFGIKPFIDLIKIESQIEKHRQTSATGLYIWMLATDPAKQGQGHGSNLLNHIDSLISSKFTEVILETSRESNIHYYAKRSYVLYDMIGPAPKIAPQLKIFYMRKNT